ncbi:UTRA domain-containing protein [Vibrio gangliei]|uniref:UTRA domain-containing protein n=1 Tax=Vibrio gangliei TaxID=2077090 RepID=UPI000D01ECA7|nr:UTRA domain-containing protein [Vibrio gangliei]
MQYVKIKQAIEEQIESGLLTPKQKLPSERALAESFDTTRVTLREALAVLESEGTIYREDRRGWFIAPVPLAYDPARAFDFLVLAQSQQREAKIHVVSAKMMLANKQAASVLELPPFSQVYCLQRVYWLDERPVSYVTHYVRADKFEKFLEHELSDSLSNIYRQHYQKSYHQVQFRLGASSLFDDLAQALRATSGSPATLIETVNYSESGEKLDCSFEYWRQDAICVESTIDVINFG